MTSREAISEIILFNGLLNNIGIIEILYLYMNVVLTKKIGGARVNQSTENQVCYNFKTLG